MSSRLSVFLSCCVLLCTVLVFAANIYNLDSFPLDDAWIHRVYARAVARGEGFAYNAGQQEAGLTSPLWVLVTAPAHWLDPFGWHIVTVAVKLIGIGLGFGSLLVLHRLAYHITRSALVAGLATALFALEPRFLVSLSSGMEPVLVLFLWLSMSLALLQSRWGWAALWLSLLPLARPESLVFFVVWIPAVWLCSKQSSWTRVGLSLLIWLPAGLWGVFCYTTTGHWLPNTFYLKARAVPWTWATFRPLWDIFTTRGYSATLLFPLGLGLCLLVFSARRQACLLLFWFVGPILYLLGVAATRQLVPGYYYWTRWTDPGVLMLTVGCCLGLAALVSPDLPTRVPRSWRGVFLVLLLVSASPSFAQTFLATRDHYFSDCRAIYHLNMEAGWWAAFHVPPDATIGVNDAGAIRYFGDRPTLDLVGLNSADLAFGRISRFEALESVEWLIVFPAWVAPYQEYVTTHFTQRWEFSLPLSEYTICDCPGQTRIVILERIF